MEGNRTWTLDLLSVGLFWLKRPVGWGQPGGVSTWDVAPGKQGCRVALALVSAGTTPVLAPACTWDPVWPLLLHHCSSRVKVPMLGEVDHTLWKRTSSDPTLRASAPVSWDLPLLQEGIVDH